MNGRLNYYYLIANVVGVFLVASSSARTLYVSTTDLTNRGTSWDEPVNLRTALFRADDGDEIWVKAGFYDESIIMRTGVSLYGGFVGNETAIDQRIPFANDSILGATDFPYVPGPIITAATGTTIDGLWIGYGDAGEERGGGIRCHGVSNVRVANCFFRSNRTDSSGGGISIRDSFNVLVDRCILRANRASVSGQVSAFESSKVSIENCLFVGGAAENRFGQGRAADIGSSFSDITIKHCTLVGGISDDGSIVDLFGGKRTLTNCILRGNGIAFGGPLVSHCNLYPATSLNYVDGGGNILAPSLFRGSLPGHETDFDPMDYSLTVNSPCIDAGTETSSSEDLAGNPRTVDVFGRGAEGPGAVDIGAYEFQIMKSDLNSDGKIDAQDVYLFQEEWMRQ